MSLMKKFKNLKDHMILPISGIKNDKLCEIPKIKF